MRYFSVKNWQKFQHYKDRRPPWIKFYGELLDDYDFGRLQDASKSHLLMIWLLASRHNNRLPFDRAWVASKINATSPVDLEDLEDKGFIECDEKREQEASDLLAKRYARDRDRDRDRLHPSDGADAPLKGDADKDLKTRIFGPLLDWMKKQSGKSDAQCRAMLGRWVSKYGEARTIEAVTAAARNAPLDLIPYVERIISDGKRSKPNGRDIVTAHARGLAAAIGIDGVEDRGTAPAVVNQ